METRDKPAGKRPWPFALFGLPFAGAGYAVLWFLVVSPLLLWLDVQQWEPVPAQILSAELIENRDGDGGKTWRAAAHYRYQYEGRTYESERVAIQDMSDNIGSFHQELAAELQRAASSGEPRTVYVNPDAPQEAVINRELRYGLMIVMAVFGLVFAAAGTLFIVLGLRRSSGGKTGIEDEAAPWKAHSRWNSPEVRSRAGGIVVFAWLFALFWSAISGAATYLVVLDFLEKGNKGALFVLVFDVVAVALLAWAIHTTISARKFGELVLKMDPHPGSIGGDVGGLVELPLLHDPARTITVTLSCLHVYTRGSGKNRQTRRDPVWSDCRRFLTEPLASGDSGLHFRFVVPEGLPVSTQPDNDYHEWVVALDCALPGVDLSREFVAPVFATGASMRMASRVRESQLESLTHLEQLMNPEQTADGIALDYRAGRHLGSGLRLALVGALFVALPLVIRQLIGETATAVPTLVAGAVMLVGLGLVIGGLWKAGNRLRVHIDTGGVRIRRDWLGIKVRERIEPRASIAGIVAECTGSMSTGNRATLYYRLALRMNDGRRLAIGEGFRNYSEVERAAGMISGYTRLPFLGEPAAGALRTIRERAGRGPHPP